MTSLEVKAESVRTAVKSTSTCTPAIASILNELLLSSSTIQDVKSMIASKAPAKTTKTITARPLKSARPAARNVSAPQDNTKQASALSPKEKAILATEVINSTLKALIAPSKQAASQRRQPLAKEDLETPARKALRRSNSLPQVALQPRSLNRISTSPSIICNRLSRSSSSSSTSSSGHRATAECSRTAFACLRALQASKTPCIDLPPLQLENGMSALIGKLIICGLEDLATKELRILKRRLDSALNPAPKPSMKKVGAMTTPQTIAAQSLDELLDFENIPKDGPLLNLAITAQLHALKLMAISRKPSVVAAAVSKLQPECQTSPTQLLLQLSKSSTDQTKPARQLENLTQLILSLSPSVSSAEDSVALSPKIHIPPESALQLQCIALRNRHMWWKLVGHQGDVEKELLDPFSKCLAAFTRRTRTASSRRYDCAKECWEALEAITKLEQSKSTIMKSPLCTIYKLLGSLAQDSGSDQDAMSWVENLQSHPSTKTSSEVQRCAIAARLAALKLRVAPNDSGIEELLMAVQEGLEGSLKGEGSEIDELLTEVSKARRSAILLLSKKRSLANLKDDSSDGIRQLCESLILLCPRFSLRYLGKAPESTAATKLIVRFEQRRQFLAKSAFNTVDSALYLMKLFQAESRLTWEILDSLLQDCLNLLDGIGPDIAESLEEPGAARTSYYVRISNLYYSQHIDMRRDAESPKDFQHLRPLRRSVDCIRLRPFAEKQAASLTAKLERLADFFRAVGRQDEAKDNLLALRNELIESGTLTAVASGADSLPIQLTWDQNEKTCLLGRTLALLVKHDRKASPKSLQNTSLYDAEWSSEEKGAVLEYILDTLSRQASDSAHLQNLIFSELLATYDSRIFPVRRLRVLICFLQVNPDRQRESMEDVRNAITLAGLDPVINDSKDVGLRSYVPHLQALASSTLELLEDYPRIDLIKPHLISWSNIIEKCKDSTVLERNIDDVADLITHLQSIADFMDMKGFGKTRIAILRMIANINEIPRAQMSPDDLVLSYSALALQYLELGYSGKAGLALDRAQRCSVATQVRDGVSLSLKVSYADYLLRIGNVDKCEDILMQAQAIASDSGLLSGDRKSGAYANKEVLERNISDASIVLSLLDLERGNPRSALLHARRSLRIMARAWRNMERQQKADIQSSQTSPVESPDNTVNLSLSVNMTGIVSTMEKQSLGPSAWALIRPMFRSLAHLSRIYAHHGMFQDTIYYAEQAHKIATTIESSRYIAEALALTGSTWLRAGTLDKASEQLFQARNLSASLKENQLSVLVNAHLGMLHSMNSDKAAELAAYNEAEATLKVLLDSKYISDLDRIVDAAAELEAEISRLALENRKMPALRKVAVRRKAAVKKGEPVLKAVAEASMPVSEECLMLMSLKGTILRQKANAYLLWRRCDEAVVILKEAASLSCGQMDAIDHHLSLARQYFLQSADQMASDPVYSVLQDSTISFPAVIGTNKTSTSERLSGVKASPPSKKTAAVSGRNASGARGSTTTTFFDNLRQAQDHLWEAYHVAAQVSSTAVIHTIATILNATVILLSAAGPGKGKSVVHTVFATASLEIARSIAIQRERLAVTCDMDPSDQKLENSQWPAMTADDRKTIVSHISDVQRFQKDYVDIIPKSWTAISISLSETRLELCLTKLEAGHSPFVLRLPLGRNNSRDADEDVFGFDEGKAELLDIIENANSSAHGARNISGKEAKNAWWAERDELDARLKELLENVEKVWLGGFRGIFSQQTKKSDLLARFQKSFQNALDKHLPSRQKGGKKTKAPKITLDTRILELFIGLGNPSDEDCDMDEALTDLLYFVVDILQFHGERNAYDEIDFDSLVLDTLDALRCYHQAAMNSSINGRPNEDKHTILILDKTLHAFPWESLPCMDGLAVSRLPSLGCLRDRILEQQNSKPSQQDGKEGQYISRDNGAYILNPGGDLKSTQNTFSASLSGLDSWTSIVQRIPTETDIAECLTTKDVYLYFGHGSGAQYIRSKTIKKLEKCATTVLMGCSSGALTEAGEFEPYGPVMSYLLAGAPAVVGTLWDVTDRDIDRLAGRAFEGWGLYGDDNKDNEERERAAEMGKGKGKPVVARGRGKKKKEAEVEAVEEVGEDKISLVEAVARARTACKFRYLTAAAVVVYGVPVYFK